MNIFKGIKDHMITIITTRDGSPIRNSPDGQRPKGMTARQWKKFRREIRDGNKTAAITRVKRAAERAGVTKARA